MDIRTLETGSVIFEEGARGDETYRVVEGEVSITVNEGAEAIVLAVLGEGEVFGEMGMIEGRPRSATARANTKVRVEVMTEEAFNERILQAEGSSALVPYLSALFNRLRNTTERLRREVGARVPEVERGGRNVAGGVAGRGEPLPNDPEKHPLWMYPDSEEMSARTELQPAQISELPLYFGRRGDMAGVDVTGKNNVLIADSMPYRVSRNHCLIEADEEGYYRVRDRGSRLGTLVNGVRLRGDGDKASARLEAGDNSLILGDASSMIRFRLQVGAPERFGAEEADEARAEA